MKKKISEPPQKTCASCDNSLEKEFYEGITCHGGRGYFCDSCFRKLCWAVGSGSKWFLKNMKTGFFEKLAG